LFEAAACGATIVSDNWPGLETFFTPGSEILLPADAADVKNYILHMTSAEARHIGDAAQARALAAHTSDARAIEFEQAISEVLHASPRRAPDRAMAEAAADSVLTRA
jgi:spore maturation protein CgeB